MLEDAIVSFFITVSGGTIAGIMVHVARKRKHNKIRSSRRGRAMTTELVDPVDLDEIIAAALDPNVVAEKCAGGVYHAAPLSNCASRIKESARVMANSPADIDQHVQRYDIRVDVERWRFGGDSESLLIEDVIELEAISAICRGLSKMHEIPAKEEFKVTKVTIEKAAQVAQKAEEIVDNHIPDVERKQVSLIHSVFLEYFCQCIALHNTTQ